MIDRELLKKIDSVTEVKDVREVQFGYLTELVFDTDIGEIRIEKPDVHRYYDSFQVMYIYALIDKIFEMVGENHVSRDLSILGQRGEKLLKNTKTNILYMAALDKSINQAKEYVRIHNKNKLS